MTAADDPQELKSPEITALLDVRTWALATLLQVNRARASWADLNSLDRRERTDRGLVDEKEETERAELWETLQIDVHFLAIAANQLVRARRQRLQAKLPRLSSRHENAVTTLRTIREHYLQHRDAHYSEQADIGRAAREALRALDEDAHPWKVSGSFYNGQMTDMTVAGVLELAAFEQEVQAIHDAAAAELTAIAMSARTTG